MNYSQLLDRRVVVVGASASAMDSAATALEAGAAQVDLLVRRQDFPRVNFAKAAGNPGFEHGYATMPDAWKLRLAEHFYRMGFPPPHSSVLRVFLHENVGIHFSTPVLNVAVHGEALEVDTPARKFEADHLVVATGFKVDWQMHP